MAGQDGARMGLARLIRALAEIDGLERIRFTTSHPQRHGRRPDRGPSAICEKLMPYLHLPVQAGSDRILKAMNRKHTAAELHPPDRTHPRGAPRLALSGDFIVGFPGETEADFDCGPRSCRNSAASSPSRRPRGRHS
jgi:tRNA-2-methylthio-N6-dimethylallyladenosine synthase